MALSIIVTVMSIIGLYGHFTGNKVLVMIGAVVCLAEILISFFTKQLKSITSSVLFMAAGVFYAHLVSLPLWYGACFGLCLETALLGIIGGIVFLSIFVKFKS